MVELYGKKGASGLFVWINVAFGKSGTQYPTRYQTRPFLYLFDSHQVKSGDDKIDVMRPMWKYIRKNIYIC